MKMAKLPKGFYTGPDGRERFWDGKEWFDSKNESAPSRDKPTLSAKLKALPKRNKIIYFGLAGILIFTLGISSFVVIQNQNAEAAAKQLVLEQKEKREAAAAKAEQEDLENRRENRKNAVTEIEASVKTMAEQHVSEGIVDGPIIAVRCTTTGGISIDDISIRSMLFECFASNKDNGDGTMSGVYYHARANWDDGSWTYGLGRE